MKKFSESVAHVMEYIKFSEMGGKMDDAHVYHSTYLDLRDILSQVKDEEEILDEDTQTILPAHKKPDTDMELDLWDCIDHGDNKKEDLR